MMISGTSGYSSAQFASYRVTNSSSMNTSQTQGSGVEESGRPKPPPPPGGKGRGQGKGPEVDTNGDDSWSLEEMEEFSKTASETFGASFDAEEVLSTYDTNEDGSIDSSEREALRSNNAFNLPDVQNIQQVMMGRSGQQHIQGGNNVPPPPQQQGQEINSMTEVDENQEIEELLKNEEFMKRVMDAYAVQSNVENSNTESLFGQVEV